MKTRQEHQIIDDIECKYCAKCDTFVDVNNFAKNKNTWDGLHCHCFPCKRRRAKTYYIDNSQTIIEKVSLYTQNNKEKVKDYQQLYQQENKEKINQTHQKWIQENIEKVREDRKLYERKRRQETEYRILSNLRNRLGRAAKGSKSDTTANLIGCDITVLRIHLESLFQSDMTWDNYGKWHIDHIIPCASFDLTKSEDQRKCFHYTNLQPLWAIDNLKKSAKVI